MEETRGSATTLPPSYRRRWNRGLVSEGRRQRKWDAQHRTHLPLCAQRGTQPQGMEQAEAPTEVNWMLMGSSQERVRCTALNCFIWLLSPACITSSMWKVPGSLESTVMTTDKSGSLVGRKIPSTIMEQGESCLDRCTLVRANFQNSLTRSLQMRPCAGPSARTCVVQLRGRKAGHGCEVSAKTPAVPNSPFALYSPWTGFF